MRNLFIFIALPALLATGCAQFDVKDSLSLTNNALHEYTGGNLELLVSDEQRKIARDRTDELLSGELSLASATEIALINSPSIQAMLSEYWADSSAIALSGSMPNPVFGFGRVTSDDELGIERVLAIGLLDLIRLPVMKRKAELKLDAKRLALSAQVVEHITDVRNAWINAVAERELAFYAEQVFSSAEASAKLALNMEAIGNFNALSRARQQAYYANAATSLTTTRHAALAARETLIRALGLDDRQIKSLILPLRLQNLPDQPISTEELASTGFNNRLDVQLAVADLKASAYAQGLSTFAEITDIEIAGISETVWKEGERESARGFELEIELPIFRSISKTRDQMNARTLAAANRLESTTIAARSHLREAYSGYRASYDLAKHYRDEVVPLHQLISEENLLNYNGMIIGIFDLLADSRSQIEVVQSAIQANRQFWIADAALRSSMVGKPVTTMVSMSVGGGEGGGAGH